MPKTTLSISGTKKLSIKLFYKLPEVITLNEDLCIIKKEKKPYLTDKAYTVLQCAKRVPGRN